MSRTDDPQHAGAPAQPARRARLPGPPEDDSTPRLLWAGAWALPSVPFRALGLAFALAIVGIYVLVVAQFQSFRLPLVVLTPVPLTLVGIVLVLLLISSRWIGVPHVFTGGRDS